MGYVVTGDPRFDKLRQGGEGRERGREGEGEGSEGREGRREGVRE